MDYLPFSFFKRVFPNLILYSFQQIIYLKYLRIEVDLVNVLFVVFGIYTLNGKVQPNLLQVKTSDFIEFLENEETPQDMTKHVHIFAAVLIKGTYWLYLMFHDLKIIFL